MSIKRTIEKVFDVESGLTIEAAAFFAQPFDLLTQARTEQERANQRKRSPWLVCDVCGAAVRILGGKSLRGLTRTAKNFHFAHLHRSADCPIKTHSQYSKEDIKRMRYRGIAEGKPHIELKAKLYEGLHLNSIDRGQVSALHLEKVVRSLEEREWRKPDINFIFQKERIAMELQLSTTWLDVIVGRQEFYRQEGIFILWVFSSFDYGDGSRKLVESDIIYNNNYHAFIFDAEAQAMTLKERDLVLKCYYRHYFHRTGIVYHRWEQRLVKLEALSFDRQTCQVYYEDIALQKATAYGEAQAYRKAQAEEKRLAREAWEHRRCQRDTLIEQLDLAKTQGRNLQTELETIERSLTNYRRRLQEENVSLAEAPTIARNIADVLEDYRWYGIPDPCDELKDAYRKLLLALNQGIEAEDRQLSSFESLLQSIGEKPKVRINGLIYQLLDKNKEWGYILKNIDRVHYYRADQVNDLFASPEVLPLNSHQAAQMRNAPTVSYLIDLNDDILAYQKGKLASADRLAILTEKRAKILTICIEQLTRCLQNQHRLEINRLTEMINNWETVANKIIDEQERLVGEMYELTKRLDEFADIDDTDWTHCYA